MPLAQTLLEPPALFTVHRPPLLLISPHLIKKRPTRLQPAPRRIAHPKLRHFPRLIPVLPERRRPKLPILIHRVIIQMKRRQLFLVPVVISSHPPQRLQARVDTPHPLPHHLHIVCRLLLLKKNLAFSRRPRPPHISIHIQSVPTNLRIPNPPSNFP